MVSDLPVVEPEVAGGHIVIELDPERVRFVLAGHLVGQHVQHAQTTTRRHLHKLLIGRLHWRRCHAVFSSAVQAKSTTLKASIK